MSDNETENPLSFDTETKARSGVVVAIIPVIAAVAAGAALVARKIKRKKAPPALVIVPNGVTPNE